MGPGTDFSDVILYCAPDYARASKQFIINSQLGSLSYSLMSGTTRFVC